MKSEPFLKFLSEGKNKYQLAPKPARDVVSRCGRVERALGIDLDQALGRAGLDRLMEKIETESHKFHFNGSVPDGVGILRSAVRHYNRFLETARGARRA